MLQQSVAVWGVLMAVNQMDGPVSHIAHGSGKIIRLFDGPYVTDGSQRREVPNGSMRLLAFVAIRRRSIHRCHAAGTLWPSATEERSSGNLRTALWRLRRAGIDVLAIDKWTLAVHGDVSVDIHLMDNWATGIIEGTLVEPDCSVLRTCADALDLLPGWYDDWVLMERERLRQRVLHALEVLSDRLVRARRFGDAVEAAILAISAEPLRESAQKALIEAHVAEGNLAEAHRRYRVYRELARRELGIDPSTELSAALQMPGPLVGRAESG
jgi:DNA-binding SARP family transcriptional activator